MKIRLLLTFLLISAHLFSQKNELKTADKALKSKNYKAAEQALSEAGKLMENASEKLKAKYYYLKAMAIYKDGTNSAEMGKIGKAFEQVISYENQIGKSTYSDGIKKALGTIINTKIESASKNYKTAIASKKESDYKLVAKDYEAIYSLSPTDTTFLDNSALMYLLAKDYNKSIEVYNKLLEIGYSGVRTQYIATNDKGEDTHFNTKKEMDLQMKFGLYKNPRSEKSESRRKLIYTNISKAYTALNKYDKALEITKKGRKELPNDYSLLISLANTYYKLGDNNKFKESLEEAIKLKPNEPNLYYNVGVMNLELKNIEEAIRNFRKAIDLKPDYLDAYNNIGASYLAKTEPIISEMNKNLSNFDKYDKLKAKQLVIYKEALPYYEKALELDKNNEVAIQVLKGLYSELDMEDKLQQLKK